MFAQGKGLFQGVLPEEIDTLHDSVGFLAGDPQLHAHVAAYPQEHGLKAIFFEAVQGKIPAHGGVVLHFHA